MRSELLGLADQAKGSLSACPVCPVKGTCVFVTPGYEPGYCLHEYRLLHAFLARRLRAHPPAGVPVLSRVAEEAQRYLDDVRRRRPFDVSRLHHGTLPVPFGAGAWPSQKTLASFGAA